MFKSAMSSHKAIIAVSLAIMLIGLADIVVTGILAADLPQRIDCLFYFAAISGVGYYILNGYSKDSAKYYKIFCGIFAAALLSSAACAAGRENGYFLIWCYGAASALILSLAVGKNWGRTVSFLLCGGTLVAILLTLTIDALDGLSTAELLLAGTRVILIAETAIMTYAKYLDKSERGSK